MVLLYYNTGRPITGPEIATLLEVLVNAANEGSVAEVIANWLIGNSSFNIHVPIQIPGRWAVFIDQLKVSSLEDCLTYYESDMAVIIRQHRNGRYVCKYIV